MDRAELTTLFHHGRRRLPFGQYRGWPVATVPSSYLRWLLNPDLDSALRFTVPSPLLALATNQLRMRAYATQRFSGIVHGSEPTLLVQLDGPLATSHPPLALFATDVQALAFLATLPTTPDVDEDRIHVWNLTPDNHRWLVWHLTGYHRSLLSPEMPQGALPGHRAPWLEELATIPSTSRGQSSMTTGRRYVADGLYR